MVLATTISTMLLEYWTKVATPIGVIGVTGQLVFTGRMVVQWWASEKRGASVVHCPQSHAYFRQLTRGSSMQRLCHFKVAIGRLYRYLSVRTVR